MLHPLWLALKELEGAVSAMGEQSNHYPSPAVNPAYYINYQLGKICPLVQ